MHGCPSFSVQKCLVIPLFIIVRLVVIPALGLACVYAAKQHMPWLVGDPLTQV